MRIGSGNSRPSKIVLVTGASRGIGAEVARQLASPDTHVLINYREKAKRAELVADEIVAAGGSASTVAADISDPTDCINLMAHLTKDFHGLDALVLNASGGLELGADPDYPMRINRDAPVRLAQLAMPLMASGGRIVFVTSHQAHFHGAKHVPADYVPIAESKRAGEDALRAMQPEFASRDIDFTVVSGDMIEGTIIIRLLPVGSNLLTNLAAGAIGVPLLPFLLASLVGYLPQMAVFALMGSGVDVGAEWQVALGIGLFVVLMVVGLWIYGRYRRQIRAKRKTARKTSAD